MVQHPQRKEKKHCSSKAECVNKLFMILKKILFVATERKLSHLSTAWKEGGNKSQKSFCCPVSLIRRHGPVSLCNLQHRFLNYSIKQRNPVMTKGTVSQVFTQQLHSVWCVANTNLSLNFPCGWRTWMINTFDFNLILFSSGRSCSLLYGLLLRF